MDAPASGCWPHLPEGEPLYPEDFLTDQPERFFVAEMVREQILRHDARRDPVRDGRRDRVLRGGAGAWCASRPPILVERDSQKGILIGKGGSHAEGESAPRPASRSRTSWARKVYLGLFVKVREGWREDESLLDEMGMGESGGRLGGSSE